MPSGVDFQNLSTKRLDEAKALLAVGMSEGAFYLAGYAVECALKAVACKTLDIEIFNQNAEINKGFKTHRIDHLIVLAGLSNKLSAYCSLNGPFQVAVNEFVNPPTNVQTWGAWTEEARYNMNPCNPAVATTFVSNVETFITWLKNHW